MFKMIPKVIHYCWFGGSPLTDEAKKCIASWEKVCPDYQIKRWDESNYNINKNQYTKIAYANKQWAFLTDYVRLDILFKEGGVYLDTDVKLIKSLNPLINEGAFMAFEQRGRVNTGIGFACEPGNRIIQENKKYYERKKYVKNDGTLDAEICVKVTTELLIKHGLNYLKDEKQKLKGMTIYPSDYFSPKIMGTSKINITNNTYGIHLFSSSWYKGPKVVKELQYRLIPIKEFVKYKILKRKLYE